MPKNRPTTPTMKNHQKLSDERAQPHHDPRGQRQGDAQSDKQVGEDRHDPLQQRAHNQDRHD